MSGGIEDPVWITIEGEPSFFWLYIVIAIALIGSGITLTTFFLSRRKRAEIRKES